MTLNAKWEALSELFLGKELGIGLSRVVYVNKFDETTVIKVETNGDTFQNITEWHVWNELQYAPQAKYLAPCLAISPCGRMLIQRRADPLPTNYAFPKTMPQFLTDLKRSNYGLINGKLVAFDYGYVIADYSAKLRRVTFGDY